MVPSFVLATTTTGNCGCSDQIGYRFTLVDRCTRTPPAPHNPAMRTGFAFDPLDHRIADRSWSRCARSGQVRRTLAAAAAETPDRNISSSRQVAGPHHLGRVIVLLDAGLNGLPVSKRHNRPVALQERGRDDGLADPSVGSGYEETAEHRVDPSRTPARAAAN